MHIYIHIHTSVHIYMYTQVDIYGERDEKEYQNTQNQTAKRGDSLSEKDHDLLVVLRVSSLGSSGGCVIPKVSRIS